MVQSLAHIALVVRDYDEAIAWFTGKLGFTLVADEISPSRTRGGCSSRRPARREARPPCCSPAPRPRSRRASIGNQAGGRVFLFLATDDFDRDS